MQLSPDAATRDIAKRTFQRPGDSVAGPVGIFGVIFPAAEKAGARQLILLSGDHLADARRHERLANTGPRWWPLVHHGALSPDEKAALKGNRGKIHGTGIHGAHGPGGTGDIR